jgi:hypothetical protein
MRETMTFALAVLMAVPLLAGDALGDELVVAAKGYVHDYSLTPPDSIGGVIEKALPDVTNAPQLVAIVGDRFGLKEETARLITIAVLRRLMAEGGAGMETEEEGETVVADLDRDFAEALRSDPSNSAVAREYLGLIGDDNCGVPDADKHVHEVLRGLRRDQRGAVALQVMSDVRVSHGNAALFEAVTESYGLDPLALSIAGDELTSSLNAELFDRATALWLAQKDVLSASAAASRAIYAYATRRALADVLRIYRSLPAEAKAIVWKAPAAEATVRSRGVERSIGTRDVRFTLAAAFILAGDGRAARPLLPAGQLKKDDAATTAMLMAGIESPGGDAFDLVINYLQNVNASTTALVDEVFDRVANRAGYAAASRWRLDSVARADERLARTERTVLPETAVALLPACSAIEGPTAEISPAVERLLNRAPLVPFVERAVDDSARSSQVDDWARSTAARFVAGFDLLRIQTRGDEIVSVAASQSVDPSAGGYWILRSTDGGATWNRPLYTGLRVMQPYEIVIGSTLPMLGEDGVRIEVAVNEPDEKSITFPLVARRAKRTKEGVAIDLKWRDLERDSDGDGLTDLMEERILTDPNAADTDGDGLPDGIDPMPQVAFRQSSGDAAQIIATVFQAYFGQDVVTNARTIFMAGDPADFSGVGSRLRIIVMNEAEIEAASKKFGPAAATHLSPVIIDQTETRAWVQLNGEGNGATYLLEKRNGVWTALVIASWVT